MGLDDAYAGVREEILVMDPLPDIQQPFFIVVGRERLIDVFDNRAVGEGNPNSKGETPEKKSELKYEFCDTNGHLLQNPKSELKELKPGHQFHF